MGLPETVAVIPAFNEQQTIGGVVQAALRAELIDGVIVVDDGSVDLTTRAAIGAAKTEAAASGTEKPFCIEDHPDNLGKTEAMKTGVECARSLGGTALQTIVFLDADSSPIWSRDTHENMKLWQVGLHRMLGVASDVLEPDIIEGRQDVFTSLLARYVDEIAGPVVSDREIMRTGMYQRNIVTDTILTLLDKGRHAGNRALKLTVWDGLMAECEQKGIELGGWDIEAALNEYTRHKQVGTFMMHGVVNVGSRVKAGGFLRGVERMVKIHGQAPFTRAKIRQ